MNALQNLTHAATLKGYLLATRAPKHIVELAQAIVDAETARAGEREQDDVPQVRWPKGIIELPANGEMVIKHGHIPKPSAKTVTKNRNVAPETPQGEANDTPDAGESAKEAENASVSTGGALKAGKHAGRGNPKLEASMLPAIKSALAARSFDQVGADYDVTGQAIINFLSRNGVDHTPFKKKRGAVKKPEGGDDWPEPVKPEKTMALVAQVNPNLRDEAIAELLAAMPEACDRNNSRLKRHDIERILKLIETHPMAVVAERLGEAPNTVDNLLKRYGIDYRLLPPRALVKSVAAPANPMMKFKTLAVKDSWGNENEIQVAEPISVEKDPETGAKVTKYPPGYAMGTGPQRNVHVKGGA